MELRQVERMGEGMGMGIGKGTGKIPKVHHLEA